MSVRDELFAALQDERLSEPESFAWPGSAPWDERPRFALDADVTVYWPAVRPCWEP